MLHGKSVLVCCHTLLSCLDRTFEVLASFHFQILEQLDDHTSNSYYKIKQLAPNCDGQLNVRNYSAVVEQLHHSFGDSYKPDIFQRRYQHGTLIEKLGFVLQPLELFYFTCILEEKDDFKGSGMSCAQGCLYLMCAAN